MDEGIDAPKDRTVSSTSSASSVTEIVNEVFEESELEISKVVSIQVNDDTLYIKNPLEGKAVDSKGNSNLRDFAVASDSRQSSDEFIPRGFRKMYIAALFVLLFAVCMGATATYSATATDDMQKPHSNIHPNLDEISLIGSLMAVGALIGGTAGGYFTTALGRKGTLMFNVVPFVIGWTLIAFANSTGMIYIGRIMSGFSTGIVSVATPMYLVEISTQEVRGLLGASFQLFVVIGILIICSLGAGLTWRWLAVSGGLMCLLATFFMLSMPESPKWLISKKKREQAKKALVFLQGESFDAEAECEKLEEEIKKQPVGRVRLQELSAPSVYKPFILSIALMFFQQFSGVNAVLFYTVDIFRAAHVSLDPIICTIIISVIQVLATLLASVLMDRAGRKPLLLISAVCMAVSLLIFGGYDLAKTKDPSVSEKFGWVPIICLASFISAFAIGYGPTPWLMVAEMNSVRFRGLVSGVATGLNWTFVFIITFTFKKLVDQIHAYSVYWIYAVICICSVAVTHFFLPETKGKNAEEIEAFFGHS